MATLEVLDIARSIKGRIREVEEQLKDHKALRDELERLKGALSRLEGGVPLARRRHAPSPAAGHAARDGASAEGHGAGGGAPPPARRAVRTKKKISRR